MKVTVELDVNIGMEEAEDFINELSNDISFGDASLDYDISIVSWDYKE